jgi:hypothetical protein
MQLCHSYVYTVYIIFFNYMLMELKNNPWIRTSVTYVEIFIKQFEFWFQVWLPFRKDHLFRLFQLHLEFPFYWEWVNVGQSWYKMKASCPVFSIASLMFSLHSTNSIESQWTKYVKTIVDDIGLSYIWNSKIHIIWWIGIFDHLSVSIGNSKLDVRSFHKIILLSLLSFSR